MNEAKTCRRCGSETPSIWAPYCDRCEAWFLRQDDLEGRDDLRREPAGVDEHKEQQR